MRGELFFGCLVNLLSLLLVKVLAGLILYQMAFFNANIDVKVFFFVSKSEVERNLFCAHLTIFICVAVIVRIIQFSFSTACRLRSLYAIGFKLGQRKIDLEGEL